MKPPRRSRDPWDAAESVFKPAAPRIEEPARTASSPAGPGGVPGPKELVSLRLDQDVLEAFQADGPGWQERINAALRQAAGL